MYQIFLTTFLAKIWICKKSDCSKKIWKRQKTSSKKTFNEKSILIISQSPPPLSVGWKCYLISVLHIPNLNLNWPSQHLLKVKNCCIVDLLWTSFVLTKQVNLLLISTQAGLLNPNQWKGGQPARYKRCFSLLLSKWVFSAQNMLTKWLNHTWTILYIEVIQCFSFKNDNNNVKRASSNKTLRRHTGCLSLTQKTILSQFFSFFLSLSLFVFLTLPFSISFFFLFLSFFLSSPFLLTRVHFSFSFYLSQYFSFINFYLICIFAPKLFAFISANNSPISPAASTSSCFR